MVDRPSALLDAALSARVRSAARTVGDALADVPAATSSDGAGLATGVAGAALLQVWLAHAGLGQAERVERLLDRAMTAVAEVEMLPTLLFGFLGTAFVVDQARTLGLLDAGPDANSELDEAILGFLARGAPGMGPELKDGLVGVGVYGLSRLDMRAGRTIAEHVIGLLAERAERDAEGLRWPYEPPDAPPDHGGRANLWGTGMTGGASGHVGLLSRACAAGVAVEQARPLLEGGVRWLLAQRREGQSVSGYPTFLMPGGVVRAEGRLSWCNGDLAIALSLLHAARTLGVPEWEDEARRVARLCAARVASETEVTTAGLCHGAAGVGHIFHRLYRATSDPALGDAARSWLGRALAQQPREMPVDGAPDPGILDGAAGVGLAFTAAVLDDEPSWDRLFLMDLPGPER